MAGELVLIGVVHRDPRGEQRLSEFLRREAPAAVSLELSPPSVELRKEGRLMRRLALLLVRIGHHGLAAAVERGEPVPGRIGELAAGMSTPYELRAAEKYGRDSGARVELLDDPLAAQRAIALVEAELLTEANLRALLDEDARAPAPVDAVSQQYARARHYFGSPELFRYQIPASQISDLEARDAYVVAGLERLQGEVDGKIVHVAGWEHLVDAGLRTLYPLLKGRARRELLGEGEA